LFDALKLRLKPFPAPSAMVNASQKKKKLNATGREKEKEEEKVIQMGEQLSKQPVARRALGTPIGHKPLQHVAPWQST
jgi:hypothetical protein